jgi:4-hydroxybutyryl-CoA dehydratase/vinylacetyl-CoA-Delta-isomerase
MIKTGEEYRKDIKKIKPRVYLGGELIEDITEHPVTKTVINTISAIYDLANDPKYKDVMVAKSELVGEDVCRFLNPCRSKEDLFKKHEAGKLAARTVGMCYYRCGDAFDSLFATTWEMDRDLGTSYHKKFTEYWKTVHRCDLQLSGGITDVKGDRSKRPCQQEDPDMYLHIVEKRNDGIIVRGCKISQSGAYAANEHIVTPTTTLGKGEEDYAVIFAIPAGTEGITYIAQHTPYTCERIMEKSEHIGNPNYGVRETCMMVLDDVFVPWERVFMCGEIEYVPKLLSRFIRTHRWQCSAACKVGVMDVIIGATKLMAEQLGIDGSSHVREKLLQMIKDATLAEACGIASIEKATEDPEGSGCYFPDPVFSNVAKWHGAEAFWRMLQNAGDIVGGIGVTMPSEKELENPETRDYINKYLKTTVPAPERMRLVKFIQYWVAGLHGVGTWQGGGTPEFSKIPIYREYDFEERKELAKRICGLDKIK